MIKPSEYDTRGGRVIHDPGVRGGVPVGACQNFLRAGAPAESSLLAPERLGRDRYVIDVNGTREIAGIGARAEP